MLQSVSILTGPLRPVLSPVDIVDPTIYGVSILTGPLRPVLSLVYEYLNNVIDVSILTGPLRPVLYMVPNLLFWLGFFPRLRGRAAAGLKSDLQPFDFNEKIVIFRYDSSNAILPGFVPLLLVRAQTSRGSSKFTAGLTP